MSIYHYSKAMPHIQNRQKTAMRLRTFLFFTPILVALATTAFYIGSGKELVDFFETYRLEHPHLTFAVTIFTHIANPVMYVVYGYMLWKARKSMDMEKRRSLSRKVYAYIFIQLLVSFALTRVLKISFGMPRPDISGPMTPFTLDHGHHSFPSGHTTEIVGATLPLAWWAKSFLPSIILGIYVAFVSYSRIYLGMHHIIDVLAGLLLGSFAAWCIHRLANRKKPMTEQDKSSTNNASMDQTDSDKQVAKSRRPFSMGNLFKGFSLGKKNKEEAPMTITSPQISESIVNAESKADELQASGAQETLGDSATPHTEVEPETKADLQSSSAEEMKPEQHAEPSATPNPEPAPFTDPWAHDNMNDWAQAQLNADLTPDGKPDANGNLETWSDGARNKQYNSTPDMDAFMYTQSQASNFGHPLPHSEAGINDTEASLNNGEETETNAPLQTATSAKVSKRFSGFKGFQRSYTPKNTVEAVPMEPSLATKAFEACANWPLLVLSCFLIMQVLGGIVDCRALWFSDEIRHAAVYEHMINSAISSGDWAILHLNGELYPDKPALYFWFLALLDSLPFVDMPMLFMLGTGISALFMLWATYALARATGSDQKTSLAAGFVLLTTFYFVGVTHYGRMDLLFTAIITASQICMYQGWRQEKATLWRIMAFVLAAFATLVKGPIGLALPIISAIVFILWQGKWRRLNTRDGAFGFGIMLCILLAWVTLIWSFNGADYLHSIFDDQIVKRAVNTWHHKQAWWHYLATLPIAWLPWTLIILVLPWFAWLRNPLSPILASRHGEHTGPAFLWICCITGVAFLSALSGKIVIYLLPLFPMMAILTARGIMRLSKLGSSVLFALFGILFILLGWAFATIAIFPYAKPFIELYDTTNILAQIPQEIMVYIIAIEGAGILAGICFISGIALLAWVERRQACGALLMTTIFMTALIQPLSMYTAKSLDSIMSPQEQAEVMAAYIEEGYEPMTYRIFPGTYTYYANANTIDIQRNDWQSLENAMAGKSKVVLAMRLGDWEKWPNRPANMHEVHRQWIVNRPFVLAVLDITPEPTVDIVLPETESLPQTEAQEASESEPDSTTTKEAQPENSKSPSEPQSAPVNDEELTK